MSTCRRHLGEFLMICRHEKKMLTTALHNMLHCLHRFKIKIATRERKKTKERGNDFTEGFFNNSWKIFHIESRFAGFSQACT